MSVDHARGQRDERHRGRRITPGLSLAGIFCLAAVLALPGPGHAENAGSRGDEQGRAPPPFTVGKREDKLFFYPCADCHEFMDANSTVRELEVEEGHPAGLEHGSGMFWCFSCHDPSDYGRLQTPLSRTIEFDSGYRVCESCHSGKYRDWTFGGHGKRLANWRGERTLYSCVECHNPHHPAIAPRPPRPPPPIRAGLKPMKPDRTRAGPESHLPVWEHSDAR